MGRVGLLACGLSLSLSLVCVAGCRSAFVDATVTDRTDRPILLLEVDYPNASFGTENLAPGGVYHYRFKVLGSGDLKMLYTDNAHKDHTAKGPEVQEGAAGPLEVAITPGGVEWQMGGVKK